MTPGWRNLAGGGRAAAAFAAALVLLHWWGISLLPGDFTETWLWSLDTTRSFPVWFRVGFPLATLLFFGLGCGGRLPSPPHGFGLNTRFAPLCALVSAGGLFWLLRIGTLELGDAALILDHFISLETYASVREPLESILHTEFARFTFEGCGMHPRTSFQIQSCAIGAIAISLCLWGIGRAGESLREHRPWIACIFLIGPIHLFFGYIEWYTQLAAGILVFQVFSILEWRTGRGLWIGLGGLIFAVCSHLVGFALVPAALFLIFAVRKGARRWIASLGFLLALGASATITLWWIKRSIEFEASVESTSNLFSTLLPLMREDNPNNPPGAWTYAWLSANHLADLTNEILLCGLLSLGVLFGVWVAGPGGRRPVDPRMKIFFALQIAACGAFLLLWNPWLGFPTDWDLFSFFAWPLLAFALFVLAHLPDRGTRRAILWISACPAFSLVFAWVVHYHQPDWIAFREVRAAISGSLAELRLEEAREAKERGDWKTAFEKCEAVLRRAPAKRAEVFSVFDFTAIQEMSQVWGDERTLTPLAVDFEIMSASPMTRFLVMDCWGRLFFQEGGYFNDWSVNGLPGIPHHRAVDFEIVPWRGAAVILRDDGNLYEVPVSSWVSPNPSRPRETLFLEGVADREPRFIGNFYSDLCGTRLGRGQKAVDLALDHWNERMIVLDTTGDLVADGTGTVFDVYEKAALVRCDVEVNYNGDFVFVTDHFGKVTSWPGSRSSIEVVHQIGWPAITDLELTRGGNDLYLLDGQGGVFPFTRLETAFIDPGKMRHYHPTGEHLDTAPYVSDPIRYFIDLEILPGEKSFHKMTTNFRIQYSEQREE